MSTVPLSELFFLTLVDILWLFLVLQCLIFPKVMHLKPNVAHCRKHLATLVRCSCFLSVIVFAGKTDSSKTVPTNNKCIYFPCSLWCCQREHVFTACLSTSWRPERRVRDYGLIHKTSVNRQKALWKEAGHVEITGDLRIEHEF